MSRANSTVVVVGMVCGLSVLLPLVACSGSDSGDTPGPDAAMATSDGASDAQGPEHGIANVVVTGYAGPGLPQYFADVPVVFYTPDGAGSTVVKTDAMGRASAMIEKSSFVAVVNPMNYVHVHAAIANPGDTLRFGPDVPSSEPNGSLRVTWPARVISSYTIYYEVYTSCGFGGSTTSTSMTVPLYKGCSTGPFDVVVTSRRSSQETTGVMVRRNVQATGSLVTVNLADNGGTWQVASFTNVPLTNVPNTASTSIECAGVQYLDSLVLNRTADFALMPTCSMRLLPEPQSTWVVEASFAHNDDNRFSVQMRQTMQSTTLAPIDAANTLPWITSFTYDAGTRKVTWGSETDAPFDASALRIEVGGNRYLVWRIVAPNGLPKTFKIPSLPLDLAELDLGPNDEVYTSLVNMDFVGITSADVMAHDLGDEDGFTDKPRRAATARTP